MCKMVVAAAQAGEGHVLDDVRRIVGDPSYVPTDPRELCNRLFITCYMGSCNSSVETKKRATDLSTEINRFLFKMFSSAYFYYDVKKIVVFFSC